MTEPLVFDGPEGSITVTAAALIDLVAAAARSVEGVRLRRPRRSVEVRHGDGHAAVSLELVAPHGELLAELAHAVQERVGRGLAAASGLEIERVDVEIAEIA